MNTPDHLYVDLNAFNFSLTNQIQTLLLSERRNSPFLYNPSEYYMSVVRFYLENPRFPVIIPIVDLAQTANANKLIYQVSMEYWNDLGVAQTKTQDLIFVPDDLSISAPDPTKLTNKDLTFNSYYYLYSYNSFVDILNTALKSCIEQINNRLNGFVPARANTNTSGSLFRDISVVMTDQSTHSFVLQSRDDFDDNLPATALSTAYNKIRLYFNSPLMALFSGFPNIKTIGQNRIRIYNSNGNFTQGTLPVAVNGIPSFLDTLTDIFSTNLWNPVQSIVFTSGVLPISQSLIGETKVFFPPTGFSNSGNNSNVSPIITDLQIPFEPTNQYRPYIYYVPSSPFRLIDLISNNPISDLSVEVFWRDRFGSLHPFELQPFCSVSLKLLFRHKSLGV